MDRIHCSSLPSCIYVIFCLLRPFAVHIIHWCKGTKFFLKLYLGKNFDFLYTLRKMTKKSPIIRKIACDYPQNDQKIPNNPQN